MRRAIVATLLACTGAWAQTYVVAGTVVHPDGHPAKRVRVGLGATVARESPAYVVTGDNGAFRFENLPAGKYSLTAMPTNGVTQLFGMRQLANGFGTSVATGPGMDTGNLEFRLVPLGSIHGRVTDGDGEPVERALVQIFLSTILRGKRTTYYAASRYTDDRGEYRFSNVRDSTYYLAVTGKPWYVTRLGDSANPLAHTGYVTTFYPNSRDAKGATPVQLKPGQDLTANFAVTPAPAGALTVNVKGHMGAFRVNLMFEGVGGSHAFGAIATGSANRPLVIQGLQPGRYSLEVSSTDATKPLYGIQSLQMGNLDVSVDVTLTEAPRITGKFVMVDGVALPEGAFVEAESEVEHIHTRRAVNADGTFEFDTLPPDNFRLLVGTARKMLPIREVKLDGAVIKGELITIERAAKLEIATSSTGGAIRGEAYRGGKPVDGALALLAPREESMNPLAYRGFQTDSDGSFEWDTLAPGDYLLIVKEDWFDLEYANPAALRPLLGGARAVHVSGTETQKIRVEMK